MKRFFSALLVLAASFAVSAQQMPPVPVDAAVRIGHLDNGLTYYIRHNEEPKGQANFYIAQKVGSILEDENQRGLAHFLEHMCFNGTQHFPGNGVIHYCEKIGVKFGADLNAYTSIDETVYNIDNVPVEKVPDAIDSCLWILHDWADGLLLTGEDIDHERGVIHEEWRTRSNAQMRQFEVILPRLYPGNRYGERLPIGLMEVVDNFPYQAIRDYYEKWYRPDQQGIVVVGDIDVDAVESKIKDIFGTIAKPENPAERVYFQLEDNKEPIIVMTTDKEQPYAITEIFCKHEAVPADAKGNMQYLVYQYAKQMISMMFDQRLSELQQQSNPPFIQAGISDGEFLICKTKHALTGVAVSDESGFERAMTTVYREMLRGVRNGFTASEYERARAEFMTQLESRYNQREKFKSAKFCHEYVRHFIDNEPIPGIENEFAIAQQLAPNIPVDVVNQILASLVQEGNLAVVSMLPEKEGVTYPTEAEVAASLAAVAAETIEPYQDKVSDEPLIKDLPAAGKVVKTAECKFGYKMYSLSNGATVYLKQTDFNKDQVLLSAYSWGGRMCYGKDDILNAKCADDFFTIGGLGNFSATGLTKALAGKKASVSMSIGDYQELVSGSSTPKDFETMMQLLYLKFTAPRVDEEAFASYKSRIYAALKNAESEPMTAYYDSIYTAISAAPWRDVEIKAADVEKIDYKRMGEIAKERFANAADFKFVFTGNIDESVFVPMIEQYIASLPAGGTAEECSKEARFSTGVKFNQFDREMEIPMVTNLFFNSGKIEYNLKNRVTFRLATQALRTILLEEIREKEGGTYGISANGDVYSAPAPGIMLQIDYQTSPDKYEHLNKRVEEIVSDFAKNGTTDEVLNKGKEYLLKKYSENQRENKYWSAAFIDYLQDGIDDNTGYEDLVKSITVKDVSKIMTKMLKQGNKATVIMHGVKKAE